MQSTHFKLKIITYCMFSRAIEKFVAGAEEGTEVEFRLRGREMSGLDRRAFDRCTDALGKISHRRLRSEYRVIHGKHVASGDEVRATVYARAATAPRFESKRRVRILDENEYNIRFVESLETPRTDVNRADFEKMYKVTSVRDIARTSFYEPSKTVRVDVSKVIANGRTAYEVEVELIARENAMARVSDIVEMLLRAIQGSEYILSNTQAQAHLENYKQLLGIKRDTFEGPLPYTLSKQQFLDGAISCGYAVTDKADGERFIMSIDRCGHAALCPRSKTLRSDIRGAGFLSRALSGTVLDGELVGNTYYAFDCLVFRGADVRKSGLADRLAYIDKVVEKLERPKPAPLMYAASAKASAKPRGANASRRNTGGIKIAKKAFHFNTFPDARKIWDSRKALPYELDGLIFNPVSAPYFNKRIYKWKPYDTIDLYVRKTQATATAERWRLGVAGFSRGNQWMHFDFGGVDGNGTFIYRLPGSSVAHTATLKLPATLRTITVPKGVARRFTDGVVEFKLDNRRLVPMRMRDDKMFANAVHSINDAWVSHTDPISIADLSKKPEMFCGRAYHNAIKDLLVSRYMSNKAVLDIGSGAGGDIKKYERHQARYVVGIDIVDVSYPYDRRRMEFHKVPMKNHDTYSIRQILRSSKVKTFDVVSCQFAFHYFLRSREVFDNFVKNVKGGLKKGGHLVITCLDGSLVRKMGDVDTSAVSVRVGPAGDGLFGNAVSVRLRGTRYFKDSDSNEYLVDIDGVAEKLKTHGFTLVERMPFKSFCNTFKTECQHMDRYERDYSFMNVALVFERDPK